MPMPSTPHRKPSRAGLAPVPTALLLPPPGTREPASGDGLSPHAARLLLTWYSSHGDHVADLDAHRDVATAAAWLGRRTVPVTDHDWTTTADPRPWPGQRWARHGAKLVLATLPRPAATRLGLAEWVRHCRTRLLAGDGFLLTVINPASVNLPTEVVAAAHAAGLFYHQQLLDITAPLHPEGEPRAEPATAPHPRPRLRRGRHRRVHREVYAFAAGGHYA